MSGSIYGLQTLMREKEEWTIYVHCRAYNLNLVAQDSVANQTEIRNIMNLVQAFIAFFSGSPKRLACFNKFRNVKDVESGTSLRSFCSTRWILRKPSIISITSNYSGIINWLKGFENHSDNSAKNKSEVTGYLESFCEFDAFFKLETLRMIFTIFEDANTALQGMQPNFCKARNTFNTLKEVLKDARGDTRFKVLWNVAAECSLLDKPDMPRKHKIASKFTGSGVPYFFTTPENHYRQLFYASIDDVIKGFVTRFEPTETTEHLANVEKFIISQCLEVGFVEACYKDDFEDYRKLQLHCDIFVDHAKFKNIQLNDFESVLNELVDHDNVLSHFISLIPEFVKLVCSPTSNLQSIFCHQNKLFLFQFQLLQHKVSMII
ncbi:uncharacterized protein LOC105846373 [Hydra vulgaris]|uniref:uncharacterized protein LOC105846373 n=1 Tax=Hydra vulgaris TaxID=6087 RepID=UPI001F5EB3C5|nr:uncharacterized protein LOC105846373 [Hydra vulgaris]